MLFTLLSAIVTLTVAWSRRGFIVLTAALPPDMTELAHWNVSMNF
jgi:hypothetical protein